MSVVNHDVNRREVAYYEAGRVVVATVLGIQIGNVSAVPIPSDDCVFVIHGIFVEDSPSPKDDVTKIRNAENLIQMMYAGFLAEQRIGGKYEWRQRLADDVIQANEIFHALSKPPSLTNYECADELWLHTRDLVDDLWPKIVAVADSLADRRVLYARDIVRIMDDVLLNVS